MLPDAVTQQLAEALRGLRFGAIQLVVHEGRVVGIERMERLRVPTGSPEALSITRGQSTASPEVRHTSSKEV